MASGESVIMVFELPRANVFARGGAITPHFLCADEGDRAGKLPGRAEYGPLLGQTPPREFLSHRSMRTADGLRNPTYQTRCSLSPEITARDLPGREYTWVDNEK